MPAGGVEGVSFPDIEHGRHTYSVVEPPHGVQEPGLASGWVIGLATIAT